MRMKSPPVQDCRRSTTVLSRWDSAWPRQRASWGSAVIRWRISSAAARGFPLEWPSVLTGRLAAAPTSGAASSLHGTWPKLKNECI